jgi:hypothetical protein
MFSLAMNEFKDQLDAAEKEKVTKHITELREIAAPTFRVLPPRE